MLMKNLATGRLVEIEDLTDLTNPFAATTVGRELWGEEIQDPEDFKKAELGFPSGEKIPLSWMEPDYQIHSQSRNSAALDPGVTEAEGEGYNGA